MALFTCGLVDDPLPLLQHIHRMFIDWKARAIATGADVDVQPEEELCKGLCDEAKIEASVKGVAVTLKGLALRKYKIHKFHKIHKIQQILFIISIQHNCRHQM